MSNTNTTNYFHRVFLGWLTGEIERGRVSPTQAIAAMEPIDLNQNRDLFDRFLREQNLEGNWRQLEEEHGTMNVLTYFNG